MKAGDTLDLRTAEILARRAERLRAAPGEDGDQDDAWFAEIALRDERFIVPLSSLRAAIPLRGVAPVPLAASHVVGVVRYEGRTIVAYSLAALLGVRGWKRDPNVLLVVEHAPSKLCALDAELIPEAVAISKALIERARTQSVGEGRAVLHQPGLPTRTLLDVGTLIGSIAHPASPRGEIRRT